MFRKSKASKPNRSESRLREDRTREILAKVREVEIRTRRLVDEAMAGHYESVFKGHGMDFDRVRDYVRGDEIRTIDWNVTARTGQPHVKLFTEERELTMMLMIDVSASSDFGSNPQTKRELAAEVASVMAFSAVRNNDRVGLVLFTDEVELFIPPGSGRRHILRVIREILFFEPQGRGTDLAVALDFVNRILTRRAVMLLISDYCLPGDFARVLGALKPKLRSTCRRHDLVAMAVNDFREMELPDIGIVHLADAETGELVAVNTGRRPVRESFARQAEEQLRLLRGTFASTGIDFLELRTGEPYLPVLQHFFKTREHRLLAL
jgi:uncharacterized protein (DUF58 family)